jgi:hypothetical protein
MRPLLVLVGVLLFSAAAGAEDNPNYVTDAVFVPPVYFVGDLVEARLTLLLPEGKTLLPPLSLPNQPWVMVRSVQIRHDPPFERVIVRFVPFAPGNKVLPPLVMGDVTVAGVRISTNSLLGKNTASELLPPRDQLLVPHTELFVFLAFLLLIVLPLAAWRFLPPLVSLVIRFRRYGDRHRAGRQLHRDLRKLQAKVLALSGPEFYTQFSHLVRVYLGGRFHHDFQTLTASEVQSFLRSLPAAWTAEWVRLIHRADVIRFDAQEPPEREKLEDLESLRKEARHLESKEAPLADL